MFNVLRLLSFSIFCGWTFLLTASRAEDIDPEKFFVVQVKCGSNADVTLTKANAAGRFVRFIRKDGELSLQARNVETKWHFQTHMRSKTSEIEDVADKDQQTILKNAARQLDTLTQKVCNGSDEFKQRYELVLQDFRKKVGITAVPE